jgi:hypothetical protein
MKTSERCTAVDEVTSGKETLARRCARSNQESGAAKGMCALHYQRAKRTGTTERKQAELGPTVQAVFLLPAAKHARIVKLAEKRDAKIADVLREAVAHYLECQT